MKKTLYLIPGFGETSSDPAYVRISRVAKEAGYHVVPFDPTWDRSAATRWVADFSRIVERDGAKNASVIGFSFGAYIAVLAAKKYDFNRLYLCSLSPYFKDDLPHIPDAAWKALGSRRKADFSSHSFPEDIGASAVFFVGEHEIRYELQAVEKRYRAWKGEKKYIVVPDADHDLESGEYLDSLLSEIKVLHEAAVAEKDISF